MSAWKLVEAVEEVRQNDTINSAFGDKRGGRGGRGEINDVINHTSNVTFFLPFPTYATSVFKISNCTLQTAGINSNKLSWIF